MSTKFRIVLIVAVLLLPFVIASTSHSALSAVGPVDPANGFPAWYQDATGLSLAPCLDNNGFCSNSTLAVPNPALPIDFPSNFPSEGFYFFSQANPGTTLYIAALEFAFANGVVRDGDQITFSRIRISDKTALAGTYTITHPYGVDTVDVTPDDVAAGRGLRFTEDIGLAPGAFTGALTGRVGPFLRNAGGLITSSDGKVYVGNPITPVIVTGSTVTTSVTVTGPPGFAGSTSNSFILEGKVVNGAVGGVISGTVTSDSGAIMSVLVSVYDGAGMWVGGTSTDPDGNYSVGGLQTGSYKVCFDAAGYLSECYDDRDWMNANLVSVTAGQTTPMINAALSQGGVITGAVKNNSYAGIGNVLVTVYDMSMMMPMEVRSAPTDSNGNYTITGLQTGTYKVCFDGSSSGYVSECYNDRPWNSWTDISSATTVTVTLGMTTPLDETILAIGGSLTGQVTSDGTTGIANVWVHVYRCDSVTGTCNYAGMISTDMNGDYTVGGLAAGGYKLWFDTSMLIMSGSDYLSQWFNNKTDEASADIEMVTAPAASTVNVQLVKGGRISGTVTYGSTGIPGIWVSSYDSSDIPPPPMGMGATTNPDGTYSIGGLRAGSYKICFNSSGTVYLSQCYFNKAYDPENGDTVSVISAQTTSYIDAVLVLGGSVTGRVTDGTSGLFNVNVSLYNSLTGMWAGGAMTDWNGNYSVGGLATGDYKVYFSSMTPGYLSEWYNDRTDMSTADAVAVTAGSTKILDDAVLAQPGSITGSVKNEDRAGIANVTVNVYDLNGVPMPIPTPVPPMPIRSAPTDTNGIYIITGLQAGTYRICFDGASSGYINECYDDKPWNSGSDIANADPVSVTLGQTMSLNDAILARGGTIAGVVKNESGFGIGMVTVSVYDLAGMWLRGASTDSFGNYNVGGLQTGTYKVCFEGSAAGYGNECYNNQTWGDMMNAWPVAVTAGQTKVLDDVVLAQLGSVTGFVKSSGGVGIGNVWVTVYDANMPMPMPPVRSTMTDTAGVYMIIGLQTGTYKVCFDGSSFGYINECYNDKPWNLWTDVALASAVSVTAGQTANLEDAFLVMGGVIAGVVKNDGGSGIGMVTVAVYDSSNTQIRSNSTDFNGNYVVRGLPGGDYKVCFDGGMAGYASECYDNQGWMDLANAELVPVVTGQTTTLGNAVLAPGGVIAGTVKNSVGSGIGMVWVRVYDSNNMMVRETITDLIRGSYSIGGLSTGNYKVCFDAMMVFGYSSECYDDRTWMDLVNATVVSVTSGQTTTLNDAVLAQFSPISDTEPDAFAFISQTGVAQNTMVVSNAITVTEINAGAPISITGGQYSVNGETFTNGTGTVYNGDTVSVRVTSSGLSLTTVSATLTIGGVSAVFNVTTREAYQFIGFLQPVMNDGSSIFKAGRTLPVKFQLTDGNGVFVSYASATLRVYKVSDYILGTTNVDSSGSGGDDTSFRYDFASDQYIYNLGTSGLGIGTFMLRVDLDDGTVHEVRISLR